MAAGGGTWKRGVFHTANIPSSRAGEYAKMKPKEANKEFQQLAAERNKLIVKRDQAIASKDKAALRGIRKELAVNGGHIQALTDKAENYRKQQQEKSLVKTFGEMGKVMGKAARGEE